MNRFVRLRLAKTSFMTSRRRTPARRPEAVSQPPWPNSGSCLFSRSSKASGRRKRPRRPQRHRSSPPSPRRTLARTRQLARSRTTSGTTSGGPPRTPRSSCCFRAATRSGAGSAGSAASTGGSGAICGGGAASTGGSRPGSTGGGTSGGAGGDPGEVGPLPGGEAGRGALGGALPRGEDRVFAEKGIRGSNCREIGGEAPGPPGSRWAPRPPGRLRSGEKLGDEGLCEAAGSLVGGAERGFEAPKGMLYVLRIGTGDTWAVRLEISDPVWSARQVLE